MKSIRHYGIECYKQSDLKKSLPKEKYDGFMKWMAGQTAIPYKNDVLVYKHDFEKWKHGNREDID